MKEFSEVWGCNKVTFWTEGGFFFFCGFLFLYTPNEFLLDWREKKMKFAACDWC